MCCVLVAPDLTYTLSKVTALHVFIIHNSLFRVMSVMFVIGIAASRGCQMGGFSCCACCELPTLHRVDDECPGALLPEQTHHVTVVVCLACGALG